MREYARGHITADAIRATYSIPVDDVEANILLSMVDSDPTLEAKLSRLDTFEDILLINEGVDSKTLYPTSTSIRQRLGLL